MEELKEVRDTFATMLEGEVFIPDKSGQRTIEILGAQFLANENTIFGRPNTGYITRELEWYMSMSLNINTFPPPIPKIWKDVSSDEGIINSNYGHLVFSAKNHFQLENCFLELRNNPYSRRAIMIYTRPSMWNEYNHHGMSDFICTNTVQYFIRHNPNEMDVQRLFAKVDMRSNDAWSGYRNDYAWQKFIFDYMYGGLIKHYPDLKRGTIIWNCGSLHIYERNFDLVQHYLDTRDYAPDPRELLETRKKVVSMGLIREPV